MGIHNKYKYEGCQGVISSHLKHIHIVKSKYSTIRRLCTLQAVFVSSAFLGEESERETHCSRLVVPVRVISTTRYQLEYTVCVCVCSVTQALSLHF